MFHFFFLVLTLFISHAKNRLGESSLNLLYQFQYQLRFYSQTIFILEIDQTLQTFSSWGSQSVFLVLPNHSSRVSLPQNIRFYDPTWMDFCSLSIHIYFASYRAKVQINYFYVFFYLLFLFACLVMELGSFPLIGISLIPLQFYSKCFVANSSKETRMEMKINSGMILMDKHLSVKVQLKI